MATAITELQADLDAYKAARLGILQGAQSYSIRGKTITRANLEFVERRIKELRAEIEAAESGFTPGVRFVDLTGGFRG